MHSMIFFFIATHRQFASLPKNSLPALQQVIAAVLVSATWLFLLYTYYCLSFRRAENFSAMLKLVFI